MAILEINKFVYLLNLKDISEIVLLILTIVLIFRPYVRSQGGKSGSRWIPLDPIKSRDSPGSAFPPCGILGSWDPLFPLAGSWDPLFPPCKVR